MCDLRFISLFLKNSCLLSLKILYICFNLAGLTIMNFEFSLFNNRVFFYISRKFEYFDKILGEPFSVFWEFFFAQSLIEMALGKFF